MFLIFKIIFPRYNNRKRNVQIHIIFEHSKVLAQQFKACFFIVQFDFPFFPEFRRFYFNRLNTS